MRCVEVLEQLQRADPDLLRSMLTAFVQALMSADADSACGAELGSAARIAPTVATATDPGASQRSTVRHSAEAGGCSWPA